MIAAYHHSIHLGAGPEVIQLTWFSEEVNHRTSSRDVTHRQEEGGLTE